MHANFTQGPGSNFHKLAKKKMKKKKQKKKRRNKLECQCEKQASLSPFQLSSFSSTVLRMLENDAAQGEAIKYQNHPKFLLCYICSGPGNIGICSTIYVEVPVVEGLRAMKE